MSEVDRGEAEVPKLSKASVSRLCSEGFGEGQEWNSHSPSHGQLYSSSVCESSGTNEILFLTKTLFSCVCRGAFFRYPDSVDSPTVDRLSWSVIERHNWKPYLPGATRGLWQSTCLQPGQILQLEAGPIHRGSGFLYAGLAPVQRLLPTPHGVSCVVVFVR